MARAQAQRIVPSSPRDRRADTTTATTTRTSDAASPSQPIAPSPMADPSRLDDEPVLGDAIDLGLVVRDPEHRTPSSQARPQASSSSTLVARPSSAEVGSSMSSTSGPVTRVRARHMRWASPPERSSATRSRNDRSSADRSSAAPSSSSSESGQATRRLSRTVPGNGVARWKTMPTRRRWERTSSSAMSVPRNRTTPEVGTSRRLQSRSSVDLPLPEAPTRQVTPVGATSAVAPSRIRWPPASSTASSKLNTARASRDSVASATRP